jgi:riboflavin biosynthesis pyrimidine reductase
MTAGVTGRRRAGPGQQVALSLLWEEPGLPGWGLPARLAAAYAGDLGFTEPCVYANFVASLDGVTALGPEYPASGSAISGREPADRFVMALLRACADAVLIGAGTLRATPRHLWTPGHVWPETNAFVALRQARSRPAEPELIIATARGDLPVHHPALGAGAVIATTAEGARRVKGKIPARCQVLVVGDGAMLRPAELLTAIRARGHACVLTEGGPHLLGQLIRDGLLDDLFLTVAPVLAGRAGTPRPGLVAGLELLPGRRSPARLLSVRHGGSFLFLRYRLRPPLSAAAGDPGHPRATFSYRAAPGALAARSCRPARAPGG